MDQLDFENTVIQDYEIKDLQTFLSKNGIFPQSNSGISESWGNVYRNDIFVALSGFPTQTPSYRFFMGTRMASCPTLKQTDSVPIYFVHVAIFLVL